MKLKELLEDICKHGIFGTVLAYIYVIEFQKRVLPKAHILLTLDSEFKIRPKDDIDKFLSAELPDPLHRSYTLPNCDKMHGTWPMWNYKYKFSMHDRWTVPQKFSETMRNLHP
ncbi:hypothetical protein AVEN_245566-1 [Araneus ventricosus]|uniref:Helitron helicase-like domain-containing protein n=1 Tax=Araneus ventricosus TaxID=182803 RepID=A0A4Y2QFI1_ARAVE|nr:hypothetical protein AVEN_245566-1 [Araneus ventricosus]